MLLEIRPKNGDDDNIMDVVSIKIYLNYKFNINMYFF